MKEQLSHMHHTYNLNQSLGSVWKFPSYRFNTVWRNAYEGNMIGWSFDVNGVLIKPWIKHQSNIQFDKREMRL